jgi:hypothetical protein
MESRFAAAFLAFLVLGAVLASGCTGGDGGSQPPASTRTLPTTRPATPVSTTTAPVQTMTTAPVYTPVTTQVVTPAWTPGTVSQAGSSILIQGDVMGYRSARGNFIDEIRFSVVLAPRAEPVTFEIPNTQIIFTKQGTPQFGVNYLPISGDLNGDGKLDTGETIRVSIPLSSESAQYAIYPGQKFTMAIKNPPQPQVLVTTEAPPVLTTDPMVLARAP